MDSTVLIALIVSVGPTLVGLAALRQARNTHTIVNSRMTELLEVTKAASRSEGRDEQREKDTA